MRRILVTVLAAAGLLVALPAAAAPDLAAARAQIAAARAADPAPFRVVEGIGAAVQTGTVRNDQLGRLGRQLHGLGAAGLYPLLEQLQPGAPTLVLLRAQDPRKAARWEALLLDAVGRLKAPAAAETLRAAFTRADAAPEVAAAAARGLGMLCATEDVALLATSAVHPLAGIEGLAHCRRPEVAPLLAQAVGSDQDARVEAAAAAAGRWGSSWAWEAAGAEAAAAAAPARRQLGEALVAALPGAAGESRKAIERALRMLDLPETAAWIEELEARDPAAAASLRARWGNRR